MMYSSSCRGQPLTQKLQMAKLGPGQVAHREWTLQVGLQLL